jgi:hypothetical protein
VQIGIAKTKLTKRFEHIHMTADSFEDQRMLEILVLAFRTGSVICTYEKDGEQFRSEISFGTVNDK